MCRQNGQQAEATEQTERPSRVMEEKNMRKIEAVDRHNLSGRKTHTDYYDGDRRIGSSVERYRLDGTYKGSDYYDRHGRKVGRW